MNTIAKDVNERIQAVKDQQFTLKTSYEKYEKLEILKKYYRNARIDIDVEKEEK